MKSMVALIILALGMCAYLLPSFIASIRNHHNWLAILALNLLLGWTLLGWALSMVWACTAVQDQRKA